MTPRPDYSWNHGDQAGDQFADGKRWRRIGKVVAAMIVAFLCSLAFCKAPTMTLQ